MATNIQIHILPLYLFVVWYDANFYLQFNFKYFAISRFSISSFISVQDKFFQRVIHNEPGHLHTLHIWQDTDRLCRVWDEFWRVFDGFRTGFDGFWRISDGFLTGFGRVFDGLWRVLDGFWRVLNGLWRVLDGFLTGFDGKWRGSFCQDTLMREVKEWIS